jgi:hypothetical protein
MLRSRSAPLGLMLLLFAVGCSEGIVPTESSPRGDRALAVFDGSRGGMEGFYFLPPMVSNPVYSGTFDAGLSPVVEICETTACESLHARFSMTEGSGSETVRLVEEDSHYIVNWHTGATGAIAGQTYRVRVRVNAVVLGYASVTVVSTGREAVQVRSDGSIALVANQTLPVKFRIETGIAGALVVSPPEATIYVGETQQFTATVYDLHGEVLPGATVLWSSSATNVATIDLDGLATGEAEGDALISAVFGAFVDVASLGVMNVAVGTPACSWDNGGFVTHPGAGANGANVSMADPVYNIGGSNVRWISPDPHFRIADDFVLDARCTLSEIIVFGYESDVTAPNWTGATINLRSGSVTGVVVATANSTTREWSGVYRVFNGLQNLGSTARPVHQISFAFSDIELEPGTYWIDWQVQGGLTGWAPYVTRPDPNTVGGTNTATVFGNGLQLIPTGWNPTLSPPGAEVPFLVRGPGAAVLAAHRLPEAGLFAQSAMNAIVPSSINAEAAEERPNQ